MITRKLHNPEIVTNNGIKNFHLEQFDGDPSEVRPGRFWFDVQRGKIRYAFKYQPEDIEVNVGTVEDTNDIVKVVEQAHGLPYETFLGTVSNQSEFTDWLTLVSAATTEEIPIQWTYAAEDHTAVIPDVRSTVADVTFTVKKGELITFYTGSGWYTPGELYALETQYNNNELRGTLLVSDHTFTGGESGTEELYLALLVDIRPHTGIAAILAVQDSLVQKTLTIINSRRWTYTSTEAALEHTPLPTGLLPPAFGSNVIPSTFLTHMSVEVWVQDGATGKWSQDSGSVVIDTVNEPHLKVAFTEPVNVVVIMENRTPITS